MDLWVFEANVVYRKTARATQRNPVWKNQKRSGEMAQQLKAKSTSCFSRGLGLDSQHSYGGLQPSILPAPGNLTRSFGLLRHMYVACIYSYMQQNTHTHEVSI